MAGRARSGRAVHAAGGGRLRATGALAVVAALVAFGAALFGAPAGAASQTVDAQLSLSGLASPDNPLGGSRIGVHPGDKVTFSAAGVPTAGLDKAGLGGLVGGITGLLTKFQVTADFSALPGGAKNTVLSGTTTKTFTFTKKGTFAFTWSFQSVNILGGIAPLPPITFDGNQLKTLGITLNAQNQYVGSVVAADNPPSGGLSLQLPGVKVAPSAPVVGQLPTLSIPGVSLPTVGVSVPDLNPGGSSGGSGGKTTATAPAAPATSAGPSFAPPALSIPQMVLGGLGAGSSDGGSGSGGFRLGVAGTGTNQLGIAGAASGTGSGSGSSATGSGSNGTASGGSRADVDLASSPSSPSSELPIVLAILAVIALAMVAGTYARLYLLGRSRPQS